MSGPTDREVTSHAAALRYTAAVSAAAAATRTSLEQTVATMRQRHIGPAAVGHLDRARDEAGLLAEQLHAAEAVLRGHNVVREAYAAAPDAGDKAWTTNDSTGTSVPPDAIPSPDPARPAADEQIDEQIDMELQEALLRDDAAQERGMPAEERETCQDCRTWTGEEHLESAHHRAKIVSIEHPRLAAKTRDRYASVSDPQLREALVRDDLAEDYGMHADDRETCHGCQTWATEEHLDSPQHHALLGRAWDRIWRPSR